jgi:hypothetical protein
LLVLTGPPAIVAVVIVVVVGHTFCSHDRQDQDNHQLVQHVTVFVISKKLYFFEDRDDHGLVQHVVTVVSSLTKTSYSVSQEWFIQSELQSCTVIVECDKSIFFSYLIRKLNILMGQIFFGI